MIYFDNKKSLNSFDLFFLKDNNLKVCCNCGNVHAPILHRESRETHTEVPHCKDFKSMGYDELSAYEFDDSYLLKTMDSSAFLNVGALSSPNIFGNGVTEYIGRFTITMQSEASSIIIRCNNVISGDIIGNLLVPLDSGNGAAINQLLFNNCLLELNFQLPNSAPLTLKCGSKYWEEVYFKSYCKYIGEPRTFDEKLVYQISLLRASGYMKPADEMLNAIVMNDE